MKYKSLLTALCLTVTGCYSSPQPKTNETEQPERVSSYTSTKMQSSGVIYFDSPRTYADKVDTEILTPVLSQKERKARVNFLWNNLVEQKTIAFQRKHNDLLIELEQINSLRTRHMNHTLMARTEYNQSHMALENLIKEQQDTQQDIVSQINEFIKLEQIDIAQTAYIGSIVHFDLSAAGEDCRYTHTQTKTSEGKCASTNISQTEIVDHPKFATLISRIEGTIEFYWLMEETIHIAMDQINESRRQSINATNDANQLFGSLNAIKELRTNTRNKLSTIKANYESKTNAEVKQRFFDAHMQDKPINESIAPSTLNALADQLVKIDELGPPTNEPPITDAIAQLTTPMLYKANKHYSKRMKLQVHETELESAVTRIVNEHYPPPPQNKAHRKITPRSGLAIDLNVTPQL
ncbi:hypothetical protein [Vibrio owensii]|uniref:hypothetical protein n=1 Tax=Vibrio owensii TaxID=696485 RepID=UPI0018F20700|nr:hypothetical protein [Vibrio owensii]